MMKTFAATLFCCLFILPAFSQNFPMLKQQVSLDKVMDVVADNRQDAYLARTGAGFTLIDQRSKLQIGTIQLNLEAVDLPGIGKMYLWGEAGFMVSGSGTILHADPVSGSVDTVFNELTFPEFIVNYIPWPADPNLLLIATKRYPVQKDGNVWFSKEVNGKTVYDGTKNCRLLLFDTRSRKTVGSTKISHAITCFANETLNGKLLAGTFDGDVLEINDSLTAQVAYHAFDRPVHSVARQKEMIVAVPHIDRQLIASYGDGRLCFYNTITKGKKDIVLPVQTPLQPSTSGINALPNNRVRRIFSLPSENSILVNYGFRGLLRISLPILDTTHYSQPAIDEINYYCFNRDSTQLLGVTMQEASIFGSSGELEAYDLKQQKFQSPFNKPAVTEQYKRLHKLYDRAGNYHFIGQKTGSGQDSLIIFSSNKTSPTFFVSSNEFVVNTSDTTLLLRSGSNAVLGRLHLENLDKNSYVFSVAADVNRNAEVFETLFEKQKNADGKIPWGVTRIVELQSGGYFFAGFNYVKQHTVNWVLAVDAKGNSLFHLEGLEPPLGSAFYKLSPSRSKVAMHYRKGDVDVLQVWDIRANNKLFERSFKTALNLQYFTFDKAQDVFWYAEKQGDKPGLFYQVDFKTESAVAKKVFSSDDFLSFETDIAKNLLAADAGDGIGLYRLTDRQPLWQGQPSSKYFTIEHQPEGFGFSSETEYHSVNAGSHSLYFTSFLGFKPVEIYNDYLYKGEKSAVNNLSFVIGRKAFLPGDYDVYFNRPDSILKYSGSKNQIFNELMEKVVDKRKRYTGRGKLENILKELPKLAVNAAAIPDVIAGAEMEFAITIVPAGKAVTAVHVIDNGVPVYGKSGWRITRTTSATQMAIKVPLEKGRNKLQVFVSDEGGMVSASENVTVVADYLASEPVTYFVGIGIDKFTDSRHNLNYSVKDIRDLAFRLQARGAIVNIDTLFNENVTVENVAALKRRLVSAKTNDKIVVAYSGHGLLSKNFDYFLSTYNVDFQNPEIGGLSYEAFESLLDSIPARKKLVLIDACHSGEVDKEEMLQYKTVVQTKAADGLKGLDIENTDSSKVGMKNSFELMQELFMNVGRNTGATIISAAAGTQLAQERGELKNGVFTFSILEYLNEHPVPSVSRLKEYVMKRVPELTAGLQQPTTRNESGQADWTLW